MDIKRFVQQRKRLGYSQVALSKDICTQSTLSKFENNGQIPSFSILEQLCDRLGLSIDDLNRNDTDSARHIRHLLDEVELSMMSEEFPQAIDKLKKIRLNELKSSDDKMQYFYLKGMVDTLTNGKTSTTLFNFTKILDELDEEHQTIYSQLAYLGSGILYARQNSMKHAEFFFSKVIAFLHSKKNEKLIDAPRTYYLRIVTLMYYCAEYYSLKKQITASNKTLAKILDICAGNHVTYYLPRIKLLQADNAIAAGGSPLEVKKILNEAMIFARFNNNNVVEVQTAALLNNYEKVIKMG